MKKTAQERGLGDWISENLNPGNAGGMAAEKIFNPEFKKAMESLRDADEKMRAIAAGSSEGSESLKSLHGLARKNLNRREYMTAVSYLGLFLKNLSDIVEIITGLKVDVNKVHQDFLFNDLGDEHKVNLQNLRSRFAGRVARKALLSNAGFFDMLHNVRTERGRALSAWESRYPKQVTKLKNDTKSMVNKAEKLTNDVLKDFAKMSTYRNSRKIDEYVKVADKITGKYNKFNSEFSSYYADNIKGFLENQKFADPPEKGSLFDKEGPTTVVDGDMNVDLNKKPGVEEASTLTDEWFSGHAVNKDDNGHRVSSNVPAAPVTPAVRTDESPSLPDLPDDLQGLGDINPQSTIPSPPTPAAPVAENKPKYRRHPDGSISEIEEMAPDTIRSQAHIDFYNSLESLSDEAPNVMALYISKYAESIKDTDLNTHNSLLAIAHNITGM